VQQLSTQISKEEARIKDLSTEVGSQGDIINRFKGSVSNKDVILRVDNLDKSLKATQANMMELLEATQDQIQALLDSTMQQLDETVAEAKAEIYSEVDHVKSDVDVYVAQTQDQFSVENSFMVYQIAGTFTLISCLISMWHMTAHIRRFNEPFVQRKILAILWMSPIYSTTSWLSLVWPNLEGYLAIIKDFYEAYVIYQFLAFCIAVLGKGDRKAVVDLLAEHAGHLSPPTRFWGCWRKQHFESPWAMADAVLLQCQVFTMQFVLFRPLTTLALFVLARVDYWGGGTPGNGYDYRSPQLYLTIIQNVSVFVAFSGLLKFYHAVQDNLSWCRPFPKFLCIKGIVFMTFWQGLVISILAKTTVKSDKDNQGEEWAQQAQNFLICLEMLLFSLAHFYCFPTEEWEPGYRPTHEKKSKFGDNMALGDFLEDIKLVMKGSSTKKKKKRPSKHSRTPSASTVGDDINLEEADGIIENLMENDGLDIQDDEDDDNDDLDFEAVESNTDMSKDVRDAVARLKNSLRQVSSDKEKKDVENGLNYSSMDDVDEGLEGFSETTSLLQGPSRNS